jgi:hypothetical protein
MVLRGRVRRLGGRNLRRRSFWMRGLGGVVDEGIGCMIPYGYLEDGQKENATLSTTSDFSRFECV